MLRVINKEYKNFDKVYKLDKSLLINAGRKDSKDVHVLEYINNFGESLCLLLEEEYLDLCSKDSIEDIESNIRNHIKKKYAIQAQVGMPINIQNKIAKEIYRDYFKIKESGIPMISNTYSGIIKLKCLVYNVDDCLIMVNEDENKPYQTIRELLASINVNSKHYNTILRNINEEDAYLIDKAQLVFVGECIITNGKEEKTMFKALVGEYKEVIMEEKLLEIMLNSYAKPTKEDIDKIIPIIYSQDTESQLFGLNLLTYLNIFKYRESVKLLILLFYYHNKFDDIKKVLSKDTKNTRAGYILERLNILKKERSTISTEETNIVEYILSKKMEKNIQVFVKETLKRNVQTKIDITLI